ncbi:MAG: fibronectin type III domain-containing protein [Myxococcales bacterium]
MLARACGGALALLLVLSGCDKLRAFPGFEPARVVPPAAPPTVAMGPWLLEPRPGQMTVAWTTLEPSVGRVWYGTRDPDRLATEGGSGGTEHRVVLPSLQPSTQYRYRIEGGNETGWFTSAPPQGAEGPVHVLVYGDNHTNNGDHALVVRAAAAERPQLALHTGNMVASAREETLWRIWFQEERDLLAHSPLLAAVGNQEIGDQGAAYTRYFQRRGMPAYGSLDYGPLHVVILDSWETAAGATPEKSVMSEAQNAWFEEDLRRVPEERHVWVLVHEGPWAHRKDEGMGGSESVRAAILSAHKVHPIEAVFSGHERFYERGDINGIRYLVLGGGGAPLEEPDPGAPGVQSAAAELSFATVDVCGCHAAGRVKDIAGKVIDAFTLADCGTPCSVPDARVLAASPVPSPVQEATPGRKKPRKRRGGTLDGKKPGAENRSR